jgi:SprT protein
MSNITPAHVEQIRKIIEDCTTKLLGYSLVIPFTFRSDMKRVAGYAYQADHRIELSEQLFLNNNKEFSAYTIPHEVCHIVAWILFPNAKQHHGPEFRSLMRKLGCSEKTQVNYDISSLKLELFKYSCGCRGKIFNITPAIHKKMQNGEKRYCNTCKERAIFISNEGIN